MYNKDPAQKEACEAGCTRVCSVHYTPPSSAQLPPYDQYGWGLAGKKVGRTTPKKKTLKKLLKNNLIKRNRIMMNSGKTFYSRHAAKINATMPPDETEVLGVGHREKQITTKGLIQD